MKISWLVIKHLIFLTVTVPVTDLPSVVSPCLPTNSGFCVCVCVFVYVQESLVFFRSDLNSVPFLLRVPGVCSGIKFFYWRQDLGLVAQGGDRYQWIEGIKARLSAWVASLSDKSIVCSSSAKFIFCMEKKHGFAELRKGRILTRVVRGLYFFERPLSHKIWSENKLARV